MLQYGHRVKSFLGGRAFLLGAGFGHVGKGRGSVGSLQAGRHNGRRTDRSGWLLPEGIGATKNDWDADVNRHGLCKTRLAPLII